MLFLQPPKTEDLTATSETFGFGEGEWERKMRRKVNKQSKLKLRWELHKGRECVFQEKEG